MALNQNAFAFGLDDGTESTHTLFTQNQARSFFPATTFLCRIGLQATGSVAHSNQAWTWEYNLNGAGWNAITTSSSVIRAVTPSAWANNASPTQRLTGFTGTFENSSQTCTTDGTGGGAQCDIVSNGCAEGEIALQIQDANVASGDTIQIRVTTTFAISAYNQTPSLTVLKHLSLSREDGLTPGDSASWTVSEAPASAIERTATDAVSLGDNASSLTSEGKRSVTDAVSIGDSPTVARQLILAVVDAVSTGESVSSGIPTCSLSVTSFFVPLDDVAVEVEDLTGPTLGIAITPETTWLQGVLIWGG